MQAPDGLIINFEHVVKIRKIDYVVENGEGKPLIWLKYVTGEEERLDFDSAAQRNTFYNQLKELLHIHRCDA